MIDIEVDIRENPISPGYVRLHTHGVIHNVKVDSVSEELWVGYPLHTPEGKPNRRLQSAITLAFEVEEVKAERLN